MKEQIPLNKLEEIITVNIEDIPVRNQAYNLLTELAHAFNGIENEYDKAKHHIKVMEETEDKLHNKVKILTALLEKLLSELDIQIEVDNNDYY